MEITRASHAVGAEIRGVDLRTISDADFETVRETFADCGVVFFRDQKLEPEDHIAFAERVGEININRFFKPVDGYPQVAEVLKEPDQKQNIGGGWHTDHSYDLEPAKCSILYAREVPETGGDTLFAGLGAAFEALSDGLKKTLRTLDAVHSSRHVFGHEARKHSPLGDRIGNPEAATQDSVHPVVIAHPDTGREILYVNPGFTRRIDGWAPDESKALLDFLYGHAMKPEFHTRFQWQVGSIAMWDNRATWHYALNDYQGHRRYMHRITIEGCAIAAS
jgi:taurine dioxygenase